MKLTKSYHRAAAALLVSTAALAYSGAAFALQPSNATLIVAHESNPDDVQDFIYTVDGPTPGGAGLDDDATAPGGDTNMIKMKTFSVVPGDYTISQTNSTPGWVLTAIQCDGPTPAYPDLAQRSVALNVAVGTNITCKFINERASAPPTGTITIRKQTMPAANPQDFAFYAFGPNSGCCGPFPLDSDPGSALSDSKTFTLAPGSYSFKEDFANPVPVPGWNLTSINCTGGSATVDMNSKSFTTNLLAGQNVVCTFVNTPTSAPPTGTITIRKQTMPAANPQDFAFYAFGPNSGCCGPFPLDSDPGSALPDSKTFTLPPGSYSFKEDFANPVPVPGWVLANINCTGGGTTVDMNSKSFTANLQPGQNIVCTFVNHRATGEIRIIKDAAPNSLQDFGFNASGPNFVQAFTLDDDASVSGADNQYQNSKAFIVPAGQYVFTETQTSGWGLTGLSCSPAASAVVDQPGRKVTITANANQTVTCTFRNKPTGSPPPCTANYPLNAVVNLFAPGWQTVNICRGGTVTFSKSAGVAFTVSPSIPAGSFTPVALAAGSASGTTSAFPNTTSGALTFKYSINAAIPQGTIIVW